MDLISLIHAVLRHKVLVAVVALLTLGGMFAALKASETVYQAEGQAVLLPPPSRDESTSAELENPYMRFGDLSVVVQIVAERTSTDEVREELAAEGIDDRYEVAPSNVLGFGRPIAGIITFGATEQEAIADFALVEQRFSEELAAMQVDGGTARRWLITAQPMVRPSTAERQVSSAMRAIGAIGVLGGLVLLTAVSVADVVGPTRRDRPERSRRVGRRRRAGSTGADAPVGPGPSEAASPDSGRAEPRRTAPVLN